MLCVYFQRKCLWLFFSLHPHVNVDYDKLFRITCFYSIRGKHLATSPVSFVIAAVPLDPRHPSPPLCHSALLIKPCLLAFHMRIAMRQRAGLVGGRHSAVSVLFWLVYILCSSVALVPKMFFTRSTGPEPERAKQ